MLDMKGHIIAFFILLLIPFLLDAQTDSAFEGDSLIHHSTVFFKGDTIPEVKMDSVTIDSKSGKRNEEDQAKYERIKEKVVKVYPYAKVAALLMKHYDQKLEGMELEAKKKLFMKKVEADLKAEFKDEITDLTISEGRILMKLIDRETGNTSYEIIEELRGNASAFFWQGVARIFGHDLKARYDPIDDDRIVEDVVVDIQTGEVEVPEREPQSEKVRELLKQKKDRGEWWKLKS